MPHYKPDEKFSSPISIVNKIAYQSGNVIYEPIEDLSLDKMTANLSMVTDQKKRMLEILESKKEDEKALKSHLYNLYSSRNK